jgi:hypothetical protein
LPQSPVGHASRGELRPGLALKATVAAAARRPGNLAPAGNRAAVMLVPLPVSEPDPARKRHPPYQPGRPLRPAGDDLGHAPPAAGQPVHQQPARPAPPVYLAGAQVLELFQVGVVQGNVTVAAGVLSYAGQPNFTILGDADAVPDLQAFADGVADALTQLGARVKTGKMP